MLTPEFMPHPAEGQIATPFESQTAIENERDVEKKKLYESEIPYIRQRPTRHPRICFLQDAYAHTRLVRKMNMKELANKKERVSSLSLEAVCFWLRWLRLGLASLLDSSVHRKSVFSGLGLLSLRPVVLCVLHITGQSMYSTYTPLTIP